MPFSNSSQMMSVYEISRIFLDVFPGRSDLTPQEWTLGMCKCAVNFLPLRTNYLFLQVLMYRKEETTLMPESCSEVPDDSVLLVGSFNYV